MWRFVIATASVAVSCRTWEFSSFVGSEKASQFLTMDAVTVFYEHLTPFVTGSADQPPLVLLLRRCYHFLSLRRKESFVFCLVRVIRRRQSSPAVITSSRRLCYFRRESKQKRFTKICLLQIDAVSQQLIFGDCANANGILRSAVNIANSFPLNPVMGKNCTQLLWLSD